MDIWLEGWIRRETVRVEASRVQFMDRRQIERAKARVDGSESQHRSMGMNQAAYVIKLGRQND